MESSTTYILGEGTPCFRLYQFLGGWFPENEDRPVEDIVREFVAVDVEDARQVLSEAGLFMLLDPLPWEFVVDETNVWNANEAETRQWLDSVFDSLRTEIEARSAP